MIGSQRVPVGDTSEYGALELFLWTTIAKGHQGCPLPFKPAFDFHEQDLKVPQNLRPWFSAAKWWVSRSGWVRGVTASSQEVHVSLVLTNKWREDGAGATHVVLGDICCNTCAAVVKKKLSRKMKLLIYRSVYSPTPTYGLELWVVAERTRCGYKQSTWASSRGWLGSALDIGGGPHTFRGSAQ